jgi:tetratricopeptide (TPR) repeat protein
VWLEGYTHIWQTWNNCGPATMAMLLSYWGVAVGQAEAAAVIKPHPDDKNVALEELLAYAQARGVDGRILFNGTAPVLQNLLANGYPVLVETWLEEHPNDGLGHYRLLVGYDEATQVWLAADSYVGTGATEPYTFIQVPYEQLAAQWAVFNRPYLVLYPPSEAEAVQQIIGAVWAEEVMWAKALTDLQAEAEARPSDPFVWFNLGSVLVAMGQYEQAAVAYDQARVLGLPWRMLWYQYGVFEAYVAVGRAAEAVALTQATLDSGGTAAEVYEWQARAWLALGDEAAAEKAFGWAAEFRGE